MDIEEFEAGDERSTSERIVEFLLENSDAAFTRGEIANAIDRPRNTVGTNLSRLKSQGLVRHRKNHWAITDDLGRVADADRFSDVLRDLAERYEPLIQDEQDAVRWADSQPDRPHPSEQTASENDSEHAESDA